MISRRGVIAAVLALLVSGCSAPSPVKEKAKESENAEPVTGRFAFYQMFLSARSWAPDAEGLRVRNIRLPKIQDTEGKSGAWEAVFVSASRRKARIFTYSAIEGEGNLHKGVFGNVEENWAGPRPQAQPWKIQAFKIDTDMAYGVANEKAKEYVKKNPDKPVSYLLEQTDRHAFLTWRVIWGESVATSNYSIYVDASTGVYVETMH